MASGSDWYYSQHEPEQERNNKYIGFLILVGFILLCIYSLTFIAEHYAKKAQTNNEVEKGYYYSTYASQIDIRDASLNSDTFQS